MDRTLSARVDDAVLKRLASLARQLGASKKAVLERAICELADKVQLEERLDVLDHTHGVWKRSEGPAETVDRVRNVFSDSMTRHRRSGNPRFRAQSERYATERPFRPARSVPRGLAR